MKNKCTFKIQQQQQYQLQEEVKENDEGEEDISYQTDYHHSVDLIVDSMIQGSLTILNLSS